MAFQKHSVPSLKGVFPPPRKEHKRDFLRENKLKVKDLQKHIINRKQQLKDIEEENQRNQQQLQERLARTSRQTNKSIQGQRHRSTSNSTALSLRRIDSGCSTCLPSLSKKSCGSSYCRKYRDSSPIHSSKSSGSTQCDKEIQTDDILDEDFLSDALKRCTSRDGFVLQDDINSINLEISPQLPSNEMHLRNDQVPSLHALSERLNGPDYTKPYHKVPTSASWNLDLKNLKLDDDRPSTVLSITKKKSPQSALESGYIKLPKYLEREKRERELEKIREMEKDPHCPEGHYALDEKDRQMALEMAESKFRSLVSELNHMPMSSVTLRVRTRKNEIEKALVDLENTIRIYSKQKVYIKCE